MLNKNFILEQLELYMNSKRQISTKEFDELFSMLDRKQQYEVIDIMIDNDIDYVDTKDDEKLNISAKNYEDKYLPISEYIALDKLSNEMLCMLYQEGNEITLSVLVEKNKRLVFNKAYQISKEYKNSCMTIDDLYQEGIIGLIEAAKKFNKHFEDKFITYAWYWIIQKMLRSVMDVGYMIRLPVYLFEKIVQISRIVQMHENLNEKQILEKIISELDGDIEKDKIGLYLQLYNNYMCNTSLNSRINSESENELIEFIPDVNSEVEDEICSIVLKEQIDCLLEKLKPREAKVIILRYGLKDGRFRTLEEVGKEFNVTRERIRQIENKALKKLKRNKRLIYEFIED